MLDGEGQTLARTGLFASYMLPFLRRSLLIFVVNARCSPESGRSAADLYSQRNYFHERRKIGEYDDRECHLFVILIFMSPKETSSASVRLGQVVDGKG
jgi:hypothetical protein